MSPSSGFLGRVKVFVVSLGWDYSACGADHRNLQGLFVLVPQILVRIVKVVALSELQVVERIQEQRCANCAENRQVPAVDVPVIFSDQLQQSKRSECRTFQLRRRDGCPQCKLCSSRRDSTFQMQFLVVV